MSNRSELVDKLAHKWPLLWDGRLSYFLIDKREERLEIATEIIKIMNPTYGKNPKLIDIYEMGKKNKHPSTNRDGAINVFWTKTKNHYVGYKYTNPALESENGEHIEIPYN